MHAALQAAIELLAGGYDDRERVIVLLTDGQVGDEDHLLRELAPKLRSVRMFTLGIDQAVNAGFLRRLAAVGAGLCELVESEDRLDAVMAKFHRRIGAPIASELALRATGLELERASLAPARVPDVYAGAPVVVFGRYAGPAPAGAAIELDGTSFGDAFHAKVARTGDAAATTGWLGASWARARIRDLEDRYAAGDTRHEAEIVAVSKRFTVLSRFTAFVAVDRSDVANPGGRVMSVVQPVEPPAAWAPSARGGGGARPPGSTLLPNAMTVPQRMPMAPPLPLGAPMPITAAAKGAITRAAAAPAAGGFAPPPPQAPPMPSRVTLLGRPAEPPRESISPAPYLATLAALAAELATATEALALRVVRQRLTEWVDDVRSVGGLDALAGDVDHLVRRLLATLDVATAREVAAELVRIAQGDGGGGPPRSRLAFWK